MKDFRETIDIIYSLGIQGTLRKNYIYILLKLLRSILVPPL